MKVDMAMHRAAEAFQPIPVRSGNGLIDRLKFRFRTLFDLQLWTIMSAIRTPFKNLRGRVLDVGCGEMPFRRFVPADVHYAGIDVPAATEFGMSHHPDVVSFDGLTIPFADDSFDHVICTEVLEHAPEPEALVAEIFRVIRPGGTLILTVPFSARVHHQPHDYHRFTPYRLAAMFARFSRVEIIARGNDICVVANKLIVIAMRQASSPMRLLLSLPILFILVPMALIFTLVAHFTLCFGGGSAEDPLGYLVIAQRDDLIS